MEEALTYMKKAVERAETTAKLAFSKIGVLMTNARLNKAMHPTNLHVNKELFPMDTVNSRLPEPSWLEKLNGPVVAPSRLDKRRPAAASSWLDKLMRED